MDSPSAHPPTVIVRHPKERLSKCSLHGLEGREDLRFIRFDRDPLPEVAGYFRLDLSGPPISEADQSAGMLLLDGTWRLAERMSRALAPQLQHLEPRSIPSSFVTAYPRAQTLCPDPQRGLASVEALYVACRLLGRPVEGLLDGYHWAEEFLALNEKRF